MTTTLLLFLAPLLVIIAAGYAHNSTPWRYCKRCGRWWNKKTGAGYNYCPENCDGIVKTRECGSCETTQAQRPAGKETQ